LARVQTLSGYRAAPSKTIKSVVVGRTPLGPASSAPGGSVRVRYPPHQRSLITQRFGGIQMRRAVGRQDSEHQPHQAGDSESYRDGHPADGNANIRKEPDTHRDRDPYQNADQTAR